MDILIVKLGALGDVINTLPLAIHLHEQLQARIHWLCEPLSLPLLVEHPYVDCPILFERRRWQTSLPRVLRLIRGQHFELVLDLQRIAKSALLALYANGERTLGFDRARCKEMTWLLPFERIPPCPGVTHMALQYLEFATYLGLPPGTPRWEIPVSAVPPISLPARYVVLNIGATKPANRWPAASFAALTQALQKSFGLPAVITGGPSEKPMAREVMDRAHPGTIDLTGRTTLGELTAVLAGALAVVSCDTGPLHLAVALGRPVVALFGPADPRRTGPYRGVVIQKELACVPCNRRECPDNICMQRITPQEIIARLEPLIIKTKNS